MKTKTISLFFIASLITISFISKTTFSQWEEQISGTTDDLFTVSAVDNNVCWAAGGEGGNIRTIIKTTNGGLNWINVSSAGFYDRPIRNIYAFNEDSAQFVLINASLICSIFYTTNGGYNWDIFQFWTTSLINSLNYISADSGMIVGNNPSKTELTIWRTTNGGMNWDSTGLNIPALHVNEHPYDRSLFMLGQKAWFCTNMKRVLYTSNFGSNWVSQELSSSYGPAQGTVFFNSPALGICRGLDVISSTTNGGTTWLPQTQPPGTYPYLGGILGKDNRFWVASGTNISITTNSGANWTIVYTAPGDSVFNDLSVARNGTNVWGVRNNGYITKGINIVGIASISKNIPVNFSLRQNYPNPFNPSTHIRFDISQSGFVKLAVYDMLGREVSALVNEHLKPGEYEAVWTADNMPSGVYFYKLTANGYSETKRMMLLK